MKECKGCKDIKEFAKFSKHKQSKDGLQPKCKMCCRIERRVGYLCPNTSISRAIFIYVITNPSFKGWVKIGRAVDPLKRLASYQTGAPLRDYEIHYSIQVEEPIIYEQYFIENCKHAKNLKRPEWFEMSVEDAIDIIENIKNNYERKEM